MERAHGTAPHPHPAATTPWRPAALGLAAVLAVFGFLFVMQARTVERLRPGPDVPTQRAEQLAVLIRRQQEARDRLEAEVAGLAEQVRGYEQAIAEGRGVADQMRREIDRYRAVLGLTRLEGPGLIITVAEPRPGGRGAPVQVLQAQDLAGLTNELWSAGAEAIAVNGRRVLASTAYRDAADGIVVGGATLRPPFSILAIGDPAALEGVLRIRGGFVEGLRSVGIGLTVTRAQRVEVPALERVTRFRYAVPQLGGDRQRSPGGP